MNVKDLFLDVGFLVLIRNNAKNLKNMWVSHCKKMGLDDNLPRKCLHVKKSALVVGLFEPKKEMDYLVIKLCTGNKRIGGKLKTF